MSLFKFNYLFAICSDRSNVSASPPNKKRSISECESVEHSPAAPCVQLVPSSRVRKSCDENGCMKIARSRGKCVAHGGGKRCEEHECEKSAQGSTGRCKAHGGGYRCEENGCTKSAQGSTGKCIAHGGGKRCEERGCISSAQGSTGKCKAHGGG